MDIGAALQKHGITLQHYTQGEHETLCPRCSNGRTKHWLKCLSVKIDEKGYTFYCQHCEWTKGDDDDGYEITVTPPKSKKPPRDYMPLARNLWNEAREIHGTVAETYLRNERGISIPLPPTLRHHPAMLYKDSNMFMDSLVGAIQDIQGRVVAIHRIYLTYRGKKSPVTKPKMMLAKQNGGACRLAKADPLKPLAISEGIETGLAAMQLFPDVPVWSAISSAGMQNIQIDRRFCNHVIFYCDRDSDNKSRDAALSAGYRLKHQHGLSSDIVFPDSGKDFNDQLLEVRRCG